MECAHFQIISKTHPIANNNYLLAGVKKTFLFAAPLFRRVYWFDFCFSVILFIIFLLFVMMCHIFNSLIIYLNEDF